MFKRTLMIAVSGIALLGAASTANARYYVYNVERIQEQQFAGTDFSQNLARDYKEFATYEAYEWYDWDSAEIFAKKAIDAHNGKMPEPEILANWPLKEMYLPEMNGARARLMTAFAKGGREAAPYEAARAQSKFDCWVEQQEENWQVEEIAACKAEFYTAMANLDTAMTPKPVAMKTTTETVQMPVTQLGAVFFKFDKATLDRAADTKIDAMIASLKNKDQIELHVVGYTDSSGTAAYNQDLSRKRAEAVMAGLRTRGLNVGDLKLLDVEAKGEANQAVQTADGVREAANRRVEIFAYAKQPITVTTTK